MVGESELWLHIQAILMLAAAGGLAAWWVWSLSPSTREHLLPLPRQPRVPWTGQEVVLAFLLFVLSVPALLGLFEQLGVFSTIYDKPPSALRKQLWIWPLLTPLVVAGTFLVLYTLSRTRPPAYGMTPVRAAPNFVAGYVTWLIVAPLVIAVFFAALQTMSPQQLVQEQHPLEKLARESERDPLMPSEWILLVFQAVFAAPLLEELVFRGVLLGWLRRASLAGHVVVAGFGILCGFLAMITPRIPEQGPAGDLKWEPFLFALALAPLYLIPVIAYLYGRNAPVLPEADDTTFWQSSGQEAPASETSIRRLETGVGAAPPPSASADGEAGVSRTEIAPGPPPTPLPLPLLRVREFFLRTPRRARLLEAWGPVGGSAYLFATFHSAVWPSPIPLLLFGVGAGWLAYRTCSLVGPIVMHALFNAIACVVVALGLSQLAANGRDDTTACRPSVWGSTVKTVPGSWLPRFK